MCTIAAAIRQFPEFPVVIAANRDEVMDRPSSPPFLWRGPVPFVAPRDDQAGGTWMGFNAAGLFVGITNRFDTPRHEGRASRGGVVTRALARRDVASLHEELSGMDPLAFNAFHLFYADATGEAGVTWSDGDRVWQQWLQPGVHAFTERSFGAGRMDRAPGIVSRWPRPLSDGSPDVAALQEMLARHGEGDPLASLCIHLPQFNFGTRSSAVLLLSANLPSSRFYWAEGSPCRNPFMEQGALVGALASAPA